MERALTILQTGKYTKANGATEKSRDSGSPNGQTAKSMKVTGWTAKRMGWAFISGQTAESIEDITGMTKNTARALMYGPMVESTWESGKTINGMGKDSISLVRNSRKEAFGRKTNE